VTLIKLTYPANNDDKSCPLTFSLPQKHLVKQYWVDACHFCQQRAFLTGLNDFIISEKRKTGSLAIVIVKTQE